MATKDTTAVKSSEQPVKTNEQAKALDIAMQQIEKQFGKGSIMKMGEKVKADVEVIPTGALSLDIALGIGGVPKGRSLRSTALSPLVKRRSLCTSSPRLKPWVV